jgi:hypothetical protein
MREYGQIQSSFWQSKDAEALDDRGKLLMAYLLTGPHTNGVGCFSLPNAYVAEDFGWDSETVSETLSKLSRNGLAYRFDKVVLIPKFLLWNRIANSNVAKARFTEWSALPSGMSKTFAARAMLQFSDFWMEPSRNLLETVCQTVTDTLLVTWQNQNPIQPEPILSRSDPIPFVRNEEKAVKLNAVKSAKAELIGSFEPVWSAYPRKVGKAAALKAWEKLKPDSKLVAIILAAIDEQAASLKWRLEPQFIPHCSTWLNGQRWLDEIEKPAGPRQAQPAAPSKTFSALQKLQDMKFHDYPNDKPELAEGRDHRRLDAPDASEP